MNWAMIAANMPGAKWVVTIGQSSQPLATHEIPFADTVVTEGLLIGTVQPVHVLLPAELPPTRFRVTAAGNHSFAAILEGIVHCCDRQLMGDYNRFDWRPLMVGNCVVDIGFRNDSAR